MTTAATPSTTATTAGQPRAEACAVPPKGGLPPCDNCGASMRWETSHQRCDRCGHIVPCCEGAPLG